MGDSLSVEQIIQIACTQGLSVVLLVFLIYWGVKVIVPKYLEGIKAEVERAAVEAKKGLEDQTSAINRRLDTNTDAVDTLSALVMFSSEQAMSQAKFEDLLAKVRLFRRKANGGSL